MRELLLETSILAPVTVELLEDEPCQIGTKILPCQLSCPFPITSISVY